MVGAVVASLVLVGAYLAAGGSSYTPEKVQNPCKPRPWSNPQSLGQIANQFTISALDGAACQLGVIARDAGARAGDAGGRGNGSKSGTGSTTRSWRRRSAPAWSAPSTTPKKRVR